MSEAKLASAMARLAVIRAEKAEEASAAKPNGNEVVSTTLFRWHSGGYDESMASVIEVADAGALEALLQSPFKGPISCKPWGLDCRSGWNTYLVLADGSPIGYSNAPLGEIAS